MLENIYVGLNVSKRSDCDLKNQVSFRKLEVHAYKAGQNCRPKFP